MDNWTFWTDAESIENEIAPGHMSRRHTNRALRKHEIYIAVNTVGRNVAFGKGSVSSPAPDPQIGQAALKNAEVGEQWLKFAQEQFDAGNLRQADMDALTKRVVESQLSSQDRANEWAQEDRTLGRAGKDYFDNLAEKAAATGDLYEGRYNGIADKFGDVADDQLAFADQQRGRYAGTFQPIEDRIAKDAMTWDSDERLSSEAAKAKADVVQGAAAQRAATERSMASMGVDPRSGRFAGVSRSTDLATALASAGAQNVARDTVRQQGIQLRGQAAALGQQVLGNSNTATSMGLQSRQAEQNAVAAANGAKTAGITQAGQLKGAGLGAAGVGYQGLGVGLTAGSSAVGNQGAANANFFQNNNVMAQGFGGAMQGYANQGNIMNNLYGTQVSAANAANAANASSAAGAMGALGTVAGLGVSAYF